VRLDPGRADPVYETLSPMGTWDRRRVGLLLVLVGVACAPGVEGWDAARTGATSQAAPPATEPHSSWVDLSVVAYNTHGLKARYAGDDPERRFPAIGRLLNGYDVALLQEDFAYHDMIRETAQHGIRLRGNGQSRNPLADLLAPIVCGECGSGLSTLIAFDESALVQTYREAYEDYNGWFGDRYDAWVTKGFLAVRVRLPNGAVVDVYNTHLDAGKKRKRVRDYETRRNQLAQLREAMERLSYGTAVILGGDFNYRIDRGTEALDDFSASMRLLEVGADAGDDWRPHSIYLFYRSARDVEIRLRDTGEASEFVDARGEPLSDHPPIFARFSIRPRPL
jgi:endonuclease/exonuclease/phosphatase family metal-dependent hydrolase